MEKFKKIRDYKLHGFSKFLISNKEYNKFIKKTNEIYYILLKDTEKQKIFIEIQDKDLKKIKNTIVYIFFKINNKKYFKTSELEFNKYQTINKIKKNKNILEYILKKNDDPKYNVDLQDLLDFTKSKFI